MGDHAQSLILLVGILDKKLEKVLKLLYNIYVSWKEEINELNSDN